jgi:hypothetical protein
MKRRPDQGAEPLPPAPPQKVAAPAPDPSSKAVQLLLARTLKAVGARHDDDVIKDAGEQLARLVKGRSRG